MKEELGDSWQKQNCSVLAPAACWGYRAANRAYATGRYSVRIIAIQLRMGESRFVTRRIEKKRMRSVKNS